MRKRPVLFTIVPLILTGICASFYFQTAYVLNTELTEYSRILGKITIYNWITMATIVAAGVSILLSTKWARVLMPAAIVMVCVNNYLVSTSTHNFPRSQIILAVLLFALIFAPLYTKKLQRVLTDRRQQWWKNAFRKKYSIPVNVLPDDGESFWSQSVDVSKSGLFLRLDSHELKQLPRLGEKVNLLIALDAVRDIKCSAKVVRIEEARGFYPRGMGLEFMEFENGDRKELHSFLKMTSPEI